MPAEELALRRSVGWRLTSHARARVRERGFSTRDVLVACADPESTYPSIWYGQGRFLYRRGHLSVVVDPASMAVITVLLHSHTEWNDDDARAVSQGRAA
jgi:hypothetical protein